MLYLEHRTLYCVLFKLPIQLSAFPEPALDSAASPTVEATTDQGIRGGYAAEIPSPNRDVTRKRPRTHHPTLLQYPGHFTTR